MDKTNRPFGTICSEIDKFFRQNGISYVMAAQQLHVSPAAVSLQLSGNKRFGREAAERWNKAFGFSMPFLLFGSGRLFVDDEFVLNPQISTDEKKNSESDIASLMRSGFYFRNIASLIESSGNEFIYAAFDELYDKGENSEIIHLLHLARKKSRCDELAHLLLGKMGYPGEIPSLHLSNKADIELIKEDYARYRKEIASDLAELRRRLVSRK